jgi:hypothetical protein
MSEDLLEKISDIDEELADKLKGMITFILYLVKQAERMLFWSSFRQQCITYRASHIFIDLFKNLI